MSLINVRDKTIQAKIVYYGTALSGKTTSLQHVHKVIDPDNRVELVSLNTEGDRTFFFDFLPIPLGLVNGYHLKIQAFTVPGQVKYNLTRRFVLRAADAVIFVADSTPAAFDDNLHSMESLAENLTANGFDPARFPVILQYNKRDVPGATPVEKLREALNKRGLTEFDTIARSGEGVFEAFSEMCASVTEQLAREYRVGDATEARTSISRRLLATLISWRAKSAARAAAAAKAPPASGSAGSADGGHSSGLEVVDRAESTSVIEVSSLDVPDIPNAETLLRHAVDTNIESARLLSELTETKRRLADHVRQLAALHQTGVALSSELDSDRLLDRVLASALRTVDADHGSVLLLKDDGTSLTQKLVHGYSEDPLVSRKDTAAIVRERILARRPFLLELDSTMEISSATISPTVALVAPLVNQGTVLGALTAYVLDRPMDQDLRQRLQFLNAVASQAAVALVNSRLYQKVETFNRELERKVDERTRELARAVDELKALDRLKDDFLASMSHELLTPLQSIASAGEILAAVAADDGARAADDRREFAGVVQRESARLASLLRSVLDLSQIEADKVTFERDPVSLRDVVLASFQRLRAEFKAAQAKLKIRVEEKMPEATADAAWLGRVVDALLGNAVKFGKCGGDVYVTIRRDGAAARVDVHDEGNGIPEALRASIFEKFKQIGDVLTEKPSGLGLGLPTARLLLARMGGRIWLEPGRGQGTTFCFTLPVATPVVAEP